MTIAKWVNLVFAGIFLLTFLFFDRALALAWVTFDDYLPADLPVLGTYITLTRVIALVLAAIVTLVLYKRPGTFSYLSEVIAEMRKVTWPSIDETKRNTVVVIIFTILLSAYLALFDWIWQIVTDFLITPGA